MRETDLDLLSLLPAALVSFNTGCERTSDKSGTHPKWGEIALLPAESELLFLFFFLEVKAEFVAKQLPFFSLCAN